jgi:ubiquinone/menaquinone biosynthesis C-methylase UbiE
MSDEKSKLIQQSYDNVADEYTRRISNELEGKPFDRELLRRFANEVRGRGGVCDLGCGPGHVAGYLQSLGVNVVGLDISPGMLEQARQLSPEILFVSGDMLALDWPDCRLVGIVAFYAIVNTPTDSLPTVFREMFRVLQAGGLLLLAFHFGDEAAHHDQLWGRPISLDFFYFQPVEIRRMLEAAGFTVDEVLERGPYAPEVEHQSRRAYIFARKPGCRPSATSRGRDEL